MVPVSGKAGIPPLKPSKSRRGRDAKEGWREVCVAICAYILELNGIKPTTIKPEPVSKVIYQKALDGGIAKDKLPAAETIEPFLAEVVAQIGKISI